MSATELWTILKSGGPWGIVVILLLTIGWLGRLVIRLYDDRVEREKERNKEMLELLEKKIERDVKHEQAFNNMAKAFDRVADKL